MVCTGALLYRRDSWLCGQETGSWETMCLSWDLSGEHSLLALFHRIWSSDYRVNHPYVSLSAGPRHSAAKTNMLENVSVWVAWAKDALG